MITKRCGRCKKLKSVSHFPPAQWKRSGGRCCLCQQTYNKPPWRGNKTGKPTPWRRWVNYAEKKVA